MNILHTISFNLVYIISALYLLLGFIIDILCKMLAFIICVIVFIIAALLCPFIPYKKATKSIKPLYRYGGDWQCIRENYKISSILLKRFDL